MRKWGIILGTWMVVVIGFSCCFAKMPPSYFKKLKQKVEEKCITYEKIGILKEITHHHLYLLGSNDVLLRFKLASKVKVVFPSSERREPFQPMGERYIYLNKLEVPLSPGTMVKVWVCESGKKVVKIIIEELPQ